MSIPIPEKSLTRHPFIHKVFQTIKQYGMVQKGTSILVGVSGGPDSMALLHSLMVLSGFMDLRLGVAHLNHCLRPKAADDDEQFVKSMTKQYGLPVFIRNEDILRKQKKSGLSMEEAGREARYHFFNTVCREKSFDKIAVGHHQDDNAEQILLNLIRGSGPAGLCGIPPVRGKIIRPLIQIPHTQILDYLKSKKIDYIIDQSNEDERFARNKIRHQLIPFLQNAYNPKISEILNRLGAILQSEEEWLNTLTGPLFEQAVLFSCDQSIKLSIPVLMNFHPAVQRRISRKAIMQIKGDLRRISYAHIDSILTLINADLTDMRLDLPNQVRIVKQSGQLMIQKETHPLRTAKPPDVNIKRPVFKYVISRSSADSNHPVFISEINAHISLNQINRGRVRKLAGHGDQVAFLDWDKLQFPLIIRNVEPGDRFSPIGMRGTQKLKNFFSNNKISRLNRIYVPIFLSGESIIWIGGYRIADHVKITSETKTILRAEIKLQTDNP